MDYAYSAYVNGAYPDYYQGMNVGLHVYPSSMPYMYHPSQLARDRCMSDKPPESKPRLSKDEVELLEAHFRQNPKPPSSLKRDLAERMGVELPRINNWFQNRRAKVKQERNQEAYKERQKAAVKAATSVQEHFAQEHFPISNQQGSLEPCIASLHDQNSTKKEPLSPQPSDESSPPARETDSSSYPHESASADPTTEAIFSNQLHEGYSSSTQPLTNDMAVVPDSSQPSQSDDKATVSVFDGLPCQVTSNIAFHGLDLVDPTPMGIDQANLSSFSCQPTPADYPTEYLTENAFRDCNSIDSTSPPSLVSSPPVPSGFKSPPPAADLARRRNRQPLGLTAFSAYPGQSGLRTAAGDISRRSDNASPIRRIASASGFAPPRVMKSVSNSALRSPRFPEHRREVLVQSLKGGQSPVMGLSISAALASPSTPRTPMYMGQQAVRENTASSTSSDEESRIYTLQPQVASFVKMEDASIKTPPGTPGVAALHERLFPQSALEAAFKEEPLFTPGMQVSSGFPPELEFSVPVNMPEYVASSGASQPGTPAFPPTSVAATYYSTLPTNAEYNWPDSMARSHLPSTRGSPGTLKSKTFQFTPNMTPQHFGDK